MKYWKCTKGNDKLIVIDEEVIYNYNPSTNELVEFERELKRGIIPSSLTGVPISYIKKIISNDKSNIIKIFHGEDNETIVDARENKLKIIKYINDNDKRNPSYSEYPEKWYVAIRKPFIGLLVLIGLTYYMYDIAYYMELGYEYEIGGRRARGAGIGGLILGLAEILGSKGVIILGSILSLIPIWIGWRSYQLKRTIYELNFLN